MTLSPTPEERAALKVANAALLNSPDAFCDMVATVVFALGGAQLLQSPETAAELARLRAEMTAAVEWIDCHTPQPTTVPGAVVRVLAGLDAECRRREAERTELWEQIERLRARVSELEAAAYGDAPVRLLEPVSQIGHLHECVAAQKHRADTLNWICKEQRARANAAEARVAELEAERTRPAPVLDTTAIAASELVRADHFTEAARLLEDTDRDDDAVNLLDLVADGIRELAVERRASVEDPHDSPLHHEYRLGHDLPEVPSV
ncbi:hypothetical protein ACFWA6_18240 [Streptomyces sp. NPDC060020]|uniref:hypothetical protein n=1 Tax=Streptomyces sp. NPDC060020 TaxID=3347038 RepID=UPI003689B0F7